MNQQSKDEKYMLRCLELARLGLVHTSPNPMVGSVVVYQDKIIGEGFHQRYGEAHAEVNAVRNTQQKELLSKSTLYVNLEPCSHHGKTPPCADLIVDQKIPRVVIGTIDPNSLVAGKGIKKLKNAGIQVTCDILKHECLDLNHRFFNFHSKKRPYVILKWAQSFDGYLDLERSPETPIGPNWISNPLSRKLVHKWRNEEQAILVGPNTAIYDDPQLNVRLWPGRSPLRILIDRNLRVPENARILDDSVPTLVFTTKEKKATNNTEFINVNSQENIIEPLLQTLYQRDIQSLIVEGGQQILNSFLEMKLWDEARVFIGKRPFHKGTPAPDINRAPLQEIEIINDRLLIFKNS